ncbi:hypothetical protein ACFWJY_16905 [Streptomyces anulatus]|uniref:hypothetical protein n=1 Tax=Streptomyces anulatus TaxID=1892 RepID=UPI00365C85EB
MNALDHDLLTAARTGDTEGVRTAIEGGARVDVRDDELRTPLLLAVHGDHVAGGPPPRAPPGAPPPPRLCSPPPCCCGPWRRR